MTAAEDICPRPRTRREAMIIATIGPFASDERGPSFALQLAISGFGFCSFGASPQDVGVLPYTLPFGLTLAAAASAGTSTGQPSEGTELAGVGAQFHAREG